MHHPKLRLPQVNRQTAGCVPILEKVERNILSKPHEIFVFEGFIMVTETATQTKDAGIVGRYFHSLKDGRISAQGEVVSRPEPGWYLVTLFDWIVGEPSVCRLVRLEDMAGWLFYENSEMMCHAYQYGIARAGGPYREIDE